MPFAPGRTDATQEQTDVGTFSVLEPSADGFRNYLHAGAKLSPETLLVDRAYMLTLTTKEMTVLVGGMRALNANVGKSPLGVMCATSRMVIKRKHAAHPSVVACTLLPYDSRFELGCTLAEASVAVPLNHPHCAKFCVLGGGSCSRG